MQDEARHVAFGRLALRDYYPQLTEKERDEREEFVVEACYLLRDRFLGDEVWETLGLPVEECKAPRRRRRSCSIYRIGALRRIVPTIKDIGLWGPRVRRPTPTWASWASPTSTSRRWGRTTRRSRSRSIGAEPRSSGSRRSVTEAAA